jgi:HlyD family secretion protein
MPRSGDDAVRCLWTSEISLFNSRAAARRNAKELLRGHVRRRLGDLQLVSGMPAEVFLQAGSRTMMSYLLKPITDQLLRTFN